jgi:type VI secretion system secreted protein VgrG
VSLRAHTDALALKAKQDITVVSVNAEVRIQGKSRVEFIATKTKISLQGVNVEFAMPGKYEAKGSTHALLGGESRAAQFARLPDTRVKRFGQQVRAINEFTGEPIAGMPYKLTTADGEAHYGETDEAGKTIRIGTLAAEIVKVEWGVRPRSKKS